MELLNMDNTEKLDFISIDEFFSGNYKKDLKKAIINHKN